MYARLSITLAIVAAVVILRRPLLAVLSSTLARCDDWLERRARGRAGDAPTAAVLLLPALAILGVFGFVPLFYGIYLSLFKTHFNVGEFVGFGNYARALWGAGSGEFWNSVAVTVYYVLGTIPVSLALAFVVASFLYRVARGRGFFRTLYFLPYVTSAVAGAMVWRYIFSQEPGGLANIVLGALGVAPQDWLLEPRGVLHFLSGGRVGPGVGPSLALVCVMIFEIWHGVGFMVVIFLAGLSAIPRDLEDAARIDGANWWGVTRRITIPLLSPTIFFLSVVSVIKAFQAFNSFYALTQDGQGPNNTTQNLTVLIYSVFYVDQEQGYGATVATMLCLAIVAVTVLQWRFVGRRVHYE